MLDKFKAACFTSLLASVSCGGNNIGIYSSFVLVNCVSLASSLYRQQSCNLLFGSYLFKLQFQRIPVLSVLEM